LSAKIGEIIEASTAGFVAECYELHEPPPFGSLVKTREGEREIYGVVSEAATRSIEPGRRPIARGRGETDEEEIYRQNPQLARLLRTEFTALVVGHSEGGRLNHYLPPRPARVHGFVYVCDDEEVERFSQSLDFLSILVAQEDELIAACLRYIARAHGDRHRFLVKVGKELALLLGAETGRLNSILRRIKG